MIAAELGELETVRLLLEHGADPQLADVSGRKAIDWARDKKRHAVVELLSTGLSS
jgi:ankyrin repeat protein